MTRINLNSLDQVQYDVLKELGNIGAGNATTALSKLINAKIDMKVPKVELLGFSDIASTIASEETIMVGILLLLEGEVKGMMMFLLEMNSARALVNNLMGTDSDSEEFSEIEMDGTSNSTCWVSCFIDIFQKTLKDL